MTVNSRVNSNFPIPGVDQSSRGFRDNFAIIKEEIESLQGKNIQLIGSLISDPIQIGSGSSDIIIPVSVNITNVEASGSNLSVQYNLNNQITGSQIFYNAGKVGINTNAPLQALDVIGNVRVISTNPLTTLQLGSNLQVNTTIQNTEFLVNQTSAITIDHSNLAVGLGRYPKARLDVLSANASPGIFSSTKPNSNNDFRLSTDQTSSTMGLVLEQRIANKVGGIRIDSTGNISIHVNESMDAGLSDGSRVVQILPNSFVGIGSMAPRSKLDVTGNVYVSGSLTVGSAASITGSRGNNVALTNLLTVLANIGIITNNTTA